MFIKLNFSSDKFKKVRHHLFQSNLEQVAFIFLSVKMQKNIFFTVEDYYLIPSSELKYQCKDYVELADDARAKVIKIAWDKKLSLGEIHSHPQSKHGVMFSYSDLSGFSQFVPHIWWRLNTIPYIAIVSGQSDFDALAWIESPNQPKQINELVLDNSSKIYPTQLTLNPVERGYSFYG